jgi:hypothetical protein
VRYGTGKEDVHLARRRKTQRRKEKKGEVISASEPIEMFKAGFEPATQGFSVLCSNQLSYLNKEGLRPQIEKLYVEKRPEEKKD